jgi:hypothetical protein
MGRMELLVVGEVDLMWAGSIDPLEHSDLRTDNRSI